MYIMIKYLFTEIEEIEFCIWGRWKGDGIVMLEIWAIAITIAIGI